jgi:hypothetical protein
MNSDSSCHLAALYDKYSTVRSRILYLLSCSLEKENSFLYLLSTFAFVEILKNRHNQSRSIPTLLAFTREWLSWGMVVIGNGCPYVL